DCGAKIHAGEDDDERHDVRQDVMQHDADVGGTERAGRVHVHVFLNSQDGAAHDTRPVAGEDDAERKDDNATAEERLPDPVGVLWVQTHAWAAPQAEETAPPGPEHEEKTD